MNVGVEYGAFIGVIVFVGALALIYMLIADEVKKEDAKNKPREDWATKVIDIELESKISYRRKHHDSDKELVEEAREIYFAEISPDAKQFCSELNYEDIILAKHGKLPRSVGSWMGFSISDPGYSYSQEDARRIIREQHKFVRWVDEQLRKFGTREDLYFSYDDWHYFPAMEAIDNQTARLSDLPEIHLSAFWATGNILPAELVGSDRCIGAHLVFLTACTALLSYCGHNSTSIRQHPQRRQRR